MFRRKTVDPLDEAIAEVHSHMMSVMPDSKEYKRLVARLVELEGIKQNRKTFDLAPSGDTILLTVTNLLGIGMILKHEEFNAISSRAINFVLKK